MNIETVREYIKEKLTPEEYAIVSQKATENWDKPIEEYDVLLINRCTRTDVIVSEKETSIRKDIDDYLEQLIKPGNKELLEISRQLKELSEKLNQIALK